MKISYLAAYSLAFFSSSAASYANAAAANNNNNKEKEGGEGEEKQGNLPSAVTRKRCLAIWRIVRQSWCFYSVQREREQFFYFRN